MGFNVCNLSGKEVKNEVGCTTCKILVHAITNYMTDPANEAALGDNLRQGFLTPG